MDFFDHLCYNETIKRKEDKPVKNSSMTDVIYDYFTSRILFGYYLPGEHLPSINEICRQFQVSTLTARTAIARMREEGYIETTERRFSTVTYQPDARQEQQYRYSFLSRKAGMDDMCRNSGILFGAIVRFYLQKQTSRSVQKIRSQLKKRKGHPAKQITMFYAEAMQALNNPLALNLYWEMVRYLRTPYLQRPADFEETDALAEKHIEQMLLLIEAGNMENAVKVMQSFSNNIMQRFFQSLSGLLEEPQTVEQVPFQWQIYWDHPQLCYTIAAGLMNKINAQVYKENEFLPSCQSLAQEYGVSLITMRRTLSLLNHIYVTESQNGLGTRVLSGKRAGLPDFSHLQIRKSILFFIQALQISALTCKNVAVHTLSSLDQEGFQALELEINRYVEAQGVFLIGGVCLQFVGKNNPSAFIREVYRQLYRLLLWGHVLYLFYQKPEKKRLYETYAGRLQEALRCRDVNGFSDCFSEMMNLNLRISKDLLLELGFQEEQLI